MLPATCLVSEVFRYKCKTQIQPHLDHKIGAMLETCLIYQKKKKKKDKVSSTWFRKILRMNFFIKPRVINIQQNMSSEWTLWIRLLMGNTKSIKVQ